jgi:GNAT superfamily N-acetyltransferase
MSIQDRDEFIILKLESKHEPEARSIILEGLHERFESLVEDPDFKEIHAHYCEPGYSFFVGVIRDQVICTGAIVKRSESTAEMVYVSVSKPYRGYGFAKKIVNRLEEEAKALGYTDLILHTGASWFSSCLLYQKLEYNMLETVEYDYGTFLKLHKSV